MTRTALAAGIVATTMALATAVPAQAQTHRSAFGLYGGGMWFTDMNRGVGDRTVWFDPFTGEQIFSVSSDNDFNNNNGINGILVPGFQPGERVRMSSGWVAGAQLERWFGNGRIGLRAHGGFTDRPLRFRGGQRAFFDPPPSVEELKPEELAELEADLEPVGAREAWSSINTYLGDLNLMVRLLPVDPNRVFAPYITAGLGVVHYDPAGDAGFLLPTANAVFDGDFETQFAGNFGIGTDILPAGFALGRMPLGLRIEAVDHVAFRSPLRRLEDDTRGTAGDRYRAVHHVRLTAGLHAWFEAFEPPPVAVIPPPPVAPAPPPPAEETIRICIIDPAAPGMITEVEAIHVPATRDTLVVVNGQRVAFRTQYPAATPTYVRTAAWYTEGRPLTFRVAGLGRELVPFGTPRVIEPVDLVLIGTVHGTPLFADARDVAPFRARLETRLGEDRELAVLMERDPELARHLDELEVVYAPLEPGCVFVPLRVVDEVRRIRG